MKPGAIQRAGCCLCLPSGAAQVAGLRAALCAFPVGLFELGTAACLRDM